VIRPIETPEASEATPQRHARQAVAPATAAAKSFASVLAHEKTSVSDGQRTDDHAMAAKRPIEAPEGEIWRPVRGDDNYAKITNGPRAGLYINLSRGARRGQTFHVEHRHGERVHVYGKGDDEKVVLAAKDSGKVHGHHHGHLANAARHGKHETWAPVEGANNYADILSGPRNGYFVNTSGGERDGMAFQIVKRGGRLYHIYGKGEHRQVVEIVKHHEKKTHHVDRTESSTRDDGGTVGAPTAPASEPERNRD
jgi:hypothetical protein